MPSISHSPTLENKGWNPVQGPVEHVTAAIGDFDCTEAPRQQRYLQVLCVLQDCIRYTSRVPSRQVIHFYDCLLRKIPIEPDLGNAAYALALNDKRQKDGKLPSILPLTNEGGNEFPDTDDEIIGPVHEPPKPVADRAKPVVVASRKRASGSGGDGPSCPPAAGGDPIPV